MIVGSPEVRCSDSVSYFFCIYILIRVEMGEGRLRYRVVVLGRRLF